MRKLTKSERSWALYDWASSAFTLVIITAVMPLYFKGITSDTLSDASSTAIWAYVTSIGTFSLAIIAPILGSFASYKGVKKKLFSSFLAVGICFTALLAFVPTSNWLLLLIIYALAFFCYDATLIFYDSFLTDVASAERMNKVSSAGFALGYLGSNIPFAICIVMIGLVPSEYTMLATRASFIITASWWGIFSLPMIHHVKQQYGIEKEDQVVARSFSRLAETVKKIIHDKKILLFILAYFFYIDGVNTVITMAAPFASDVGMSAGKLLIMLLVLQVIAIPFALLYGRLSEHFGTKNMIYVGIITYTFICTFAYFVKGELGIYILAFLIGTAQGGIQALSRSYFAKLVPKERSSEYFAFFSIFSKFAAVLGPLLMGITISITGSINKGVLSIAVLFVIGGILFFFVPNDRKDQAIQ